MSSDPSRNTVDIPALIGSRICHDLISPIGAIGNGIELLTMSGASVGPELSLISESVANANARIRYYRLAFGQSGQDQATSRTEVQSILRDLYGGSRLRIDWTLSVDCGRMEAKAALLAVQCMETAMPFGGRLEVSRSDGQWRIVGEAPKLRVDPETWAILEGDAAAVVELTPALVHFALLPETVADLGRTLSVTRSDEKIVLTY
ncbi:histidine phosphotransferase family protein [Tropicimonas isoalkanivorans]|uniref:Histidine phosphotransferase ChpT n=1 Tax=Tropicimonas isoalkanivorans TaxID=441112 RepID=A0A1I1D9X5_9RHOB|nr:histidine phosphotransferase family protein [Tropicimonas isoalkanivorans]SFB71745.1 histidine phosphotransferase ChpT [Tropicimonas isoalkanivorans]